MTDKEKVFEIAQKVKSEGGQMYFVGGMVRDEVMNEILNLNLTNKDIDTETFGISAKHFKEILSSFGKVDFYGESFGVFRIEDLDVDFAMPRTERQTGEKHTDFEIQVNPFLSLKDASKRRDFTINQLMKDVLTGEIIDMHGGISDIKKGIIRHIDNVTFQEDALRIFRAAQFSARFQFEIAPETIALAQKMDVSKISYERVEAEFSKALLKAEEPSVFFKQLKKMNHVNEFFTFDAQMEENLLLLNKAKKEVVGRTKFLKDFLLCLMFYKKDVKFAKTNLCKLTNHTTTLSLARELIGNIETFENIKGLSDKDRRLFFQQFHFLDELFLFGELLGMDKDFLTSIREDFDKVARIPLVRGRNLISLGFEPSEKFKDLLEKANELQCEGFSREEILKSLV